MNFSLKQKIIGVVIAVGTALILIFSRGFYSHPISQNTQTTEQDPKLVSTTPNSLDHATILPTQIVELTFNAPIENTGEFKHTFTPKIPYKLKLSDDRKTVKIIPDNPYDLGVTYTLNVQADTKFDGHKTLGHDEHFDFQTISYKGV